MRKQLKRLLLKFIQGNRLREIDQLCYEKFCYNLSNRIPFSFARYGDGEWEAILGLDTQNCDGHHYFDDLRASLKTIITSKIDYHIGIQPLAIRKFLPLITPLICENNDHFINADILHNASEFGVIVDFFKALQGRTTILVGPGHLSKQQVIGVSDHIVIPDKDCWLDKKNTLAQISEKLGEKDDVVLFCASMPTNVYIDILFQEYGQDHSFIDIGSLLDPFAGVISRGYHNRVSTTTG